MKRASEPYISSILPPSWKSSPDGSARSRLSTSWFIRYAFAFSSNARSALKLGHARGVAMLAAVEAGLPVAEYTPAAIKRAVVGYGRAEKHQVQRMVMLMLGLTRPPSPHDAADALAVAICHVHSLTPGRLVHSLDDAGARRVTSWRAWRPARS